MQPLTCSPLATPAKLGDQQLSSRVVMSALTRTRNEPGSEAPRDINTLYYTQRTAPGALIISE